LSIFGFYTYIFSFLSYSWPTAHDPETRGGSRKKYLGGWLLIIWEATTAKRNYYKTNYIRHVEKLDLNYREKNLGGLGKIWGPVPPGPNVEPPLPETGSTVYIIHPSTHPSTTFISAICLVTYAGWRTTGS